jgi:hypothetical protein
VKGNLILHLEPEPLPTVTDQIQDEDLDLSMEQENKGKPEDLQVTDSEVICPDETVKSSFKAEYYSISQKNKCRSSVSRKIYSSLSTNSD